VPIVLVGNKSDLEEDRMVSRSRAFAVSQAWGNVPYYETSARRRQNVTEVFVDVCRQIIRRDIARARAGQAGGGQDGAGERERSHRSHRTRRRDRRHNDDERDYRGNRGRRCVIL
jgi:hypothetical protein